MVTRELTSLPSPTKGAVAVEGTQVTAKASVWQGSSSRKYPEVFALLLVPLLVGSQLFSRQFY